ncbi:unnamed protein product [Fusarium graminearum]|nr:unnamed protein product [Fusarium graminearum]
MQDFSTETGEMLSIGSCGRGKQEAGLGKDLTWTDEGGPRNDDGPELTGYPSSAFDKERKEKKQVKDKTSKYDLTPSEAPYSMGPALNRSQLSNLASLYPNCALVPFFLESTAEGQHPSAYMLKREGTDGAL